MAGSKGDRRQILWCVAVFWQRRDLKWNSYDPTPEVKSVEKFALLVGEGAHACFVIEHGTRARSCRNARYFRRLSPSIALKRKFLAVNMTVSPTCSDEKCRNFSCL